MTIDTTTDLWFVRVEGTKMFLLAVSLLCVALGDALLECNPTGVCNCVVEGLTSGPAEIDLRPIFEDGSLQTTGGDPKAMYAYNGCKAQACGDQEDTMAICQDVGSTSVGIGKLENVSFDISGSNPATDDWLVLVTYGNGDRDPSTNNTRVSQVRFVFNGTITVPKFELEDEDPSQSHFFFKVHSNAVFPRSVAGPTNIGVWIFLGLFLPAVIIVAMGFIAFISWRCYKRKGYLRLHGEDTPATSQQQQQMNINGTMKWTLLSNTS